MGSTDVDIIFYIMYFSIFMMEMYCAMKIMVMFTEGPRQTGKEADRHEMRLKRRPELDRAEP